MTMHPHDHVLRYRFDSEARPDIAHVVDLGAFDGFGECSCEDFVYRVMPGLLRNGSDGLKRCKHLLAAREALLDQVIRRIAES
jgi:predicted nucleic acid-binding Zn finger protein